MNIRATALFALAFAPAIAAAGEAPRINATTQPHVFRYADAEEPPSLNPVLVQAATTTRLGGLAMAWLFRFDRRNEPVPELATVVPSQRNGGISADGKTITFHIRPNVRWSDGAPFDADDVVFSFGVMANPANQITSRDGFDLVTKIDEPDRRTVVVHLKHPYAAFIPTFFGSAGGNPCLLPRHLLGSLPDINTAPYNELPVGIGPFRFVAWRRGDAVVLERNPLYWRGPPKLDRIVYKLIPNRNSALTELRTGEIDMYAPFGGSQLAQVRAIPSVRVIRAPSYAYNHIDFNLTRPALQEKAVRQALRLATDRRSIRDKVGHGVGYLQESVLPAPYPGVTGVPFVEYDINKANALLDRAGWKRGADGVREKNGIRLSIEFASSAGTGDVDTQLEIIRAGWQQIGVEMNVKRYPASLLFAPPSAGGIVLGSKFDAVTIAWAVGPNADLTNTFACGAIVPNGQNVMHYCNRELDPILARFAHHYDRRRQGDDLDRAVRIITQDVPTIVTSSREDLFGVNKDLKNFHPNAVSEFDDMMDVDI